MQVWALNELTQIAPITTYLEVTAEQRDVDVGAWTCTIPLEDGTGLFQRWYEAQWPGIEIYDPDTGWRFGGFVSRVEVDLDADNGSYTVTFSGNDFQALLQDRLEWPNAGQEAEWWATAGGTSALSHHMYVAVLSNCGPAALAYRRIPHLTLAPETAFGPTFDRAVSGKPVLEALRDLLAGHDGYTCSLSMERALDASGTPRLYYTQGPRPQPATVLSTDSGTFARLTITDPAFNVTHLIAMGAEYVPGLNRLISGPQEPVTDWITRYSEAFVNLPSITTQDQLNTEAAAELAKRLKFRSVAVDSIPVDRFGDMIHVGSLLGVVIGAPLPNATLQLPVVASKLTFTAADGWRRTLDVGTLAAREPLYMETIVALVRRQRAFERQLGR